MTKFVKFASIALLNSLTFPLLANADIGGLNPCKDSEVFQKRLAKTVKNWNLDLKNMRNHLPQVLPFNSK